MDSILLIYLPIFTALAISFFSLKLFKKSVFFTRANTTWFTIANFVTHGLSLFVGGSIGLLISIQINRLIFDFKVLLTALPNGVFVWYGFGPAPTPQFMSYWVYVELTCFIAFVWLIFLSFKCRKKSMGPTPQKEEKSRRNLD